MRKQLLQIEEDIRLTKMIPTNSDNLLQIVEQQNKILEEVRNLIPAIIELIPTGIEYTVVNTTTIVATTGYREYIIQYASNIDTQTVIDLMAEENSFVDDSTEYVLVGSCHGNFDDSQDIVSKMILNYQAEHDYI